MNHTHLALRIADMARQYPDVIATRVKVDDEWRTQTYAEFFDTARSIAGHLISAGIQPGERIAIWASNRPEWSQVDVACLIAGAATVPLYFTSTPDQVRHIFTNAEVRIAVIESQHEYDVVAVIARDVPSLTTIVSIYDVDDHENLGVRRLAEFTGSHDSMEAVDERLAAANGDDTATIIYTSGTTGAPKGVVLSNRAFCAQSNALDQFFELRPGIDHSLSFLPLSHAFERAWTYHVLSHGCMNTYCPNPKHVAAMLAEVQPTLLVSVPRLYEKIKQGAYERVAGSATKKRILEWALRVGGQVQRAKRKGKRPSLYWSMQLPLADRLVLANVRHAIGGPKTAMAAGGAPLRQDVEEFISACGVLVEQGYGMTETAPLISFNSPVAFKFGTVGRVMPGGEVRIGTDGEILYRGPNLMDGYFNDPEATAEAIDEEGFLHTGDVGYVDTQGFLVITDRKKDLLITSGGKNIAPQPIEAQVLADPLFEYAVLLGNNRPFVTMLVQPSFPDLERLAAELKLTWNNRDELLHNPEILAAVKTRVEALTDKLPTHEKIKDLRIALEEFSMENGLLTPTLKVKRKMVEDKFADMIEDMYEKLSELRRKKDD